MTVKNQTKTLAAACAALILFGCSSSEPSKNAAEEKKASAPEIPAAPPKANEAPDNFRVKFTTSKGPFVVEVHKAWAPKGTQRFYELVQDHYFDGNRFF